MRAYRNNWVLHNASTGGSSASLEGIFSTVGWNPGAHGRPVVVHGFYWACATTMATTDYFKIVADGATIVKDPVGARFSGGESGNGDGGLGILATSSLEAGFSTIADQGGALQSFFVWGRYD